MRSSFERTSTATSRWRAVELALVALLAGTLWQGPTGTSDVVLVGDSLAEEATPYLRALLGTMDLSANYFGGTAPCDWLEVDLPVTTGSVVVISFIGNSLTPCMSNGAGGHLQGQALVDKYDADLTSMVVRFRAIGARVVLVGQPRREGTGANDAEVAGINSIYAELATGEGVTFVDAGAAVEAPDGSYAATLSCVPEDVACGPGGRNRVRNEDGVHLCAGRGREPCALYSSGAFRFAGAIAEAVRAL